jgi:hypothetical protein
MTTHVRIPASVPWCWQAQHPSPECPAEWQGFSCSRGAASTISGCQSDEEHSVRAHAAWQAEFRQNRGLFSLPGFHRHRSGDRDFRTPQGSRCSKRRSPRRNRNTKDCHCTCHGPKHLCIAACRGSWLSTSERYLRDPGNSPSRRGSGRNHTSDTFHRRWTSSRQGGGDCWCKRSDYHRI